VVIYPLLASLACKWLQIGTDMLLIITSTDDELLRNMSTSMTLNNLKLWKYWFCVIFWQFLAPKNWIAKKWMKID